MTSSDMAATVTPPYVRLGPSDNVVVLVRHVDSGDRFDGLDGEQWAMSAHLDVGNKLAAVAIAAGEQVVKLGVPIGTATQAIKPGAHVHSHNLRSNYIPLDLEEAHRGEDRAN
jgi:hypothetical protein